MEARKQHVYSALANMVGFLFESPGGTHRITDNGTKVVPIPAKDRYRHQVRGQYLGLRAMIRFAADRGDELMAVVAEAKRRATRRGGTVSEDDKIVLDYEKVEKFKDEFWVRDREAEDNAGYKLVSGSVMTKWVPIKTTTRPIGYFLLPQMAKVIPLLLDHQISVKALREPVTVKVDALYASEVAERSYFQGHYLKKVTTVSRTEEVEFPAGTFYVPMAQPRSNLIGYLLEPETDDSLATWNYLDSFIRVRTPRPADAAGPRGRRGNTGGNTGGGGQRRGEQGRGEQGRGGQGSPRRGRFSRRGRRPRGPGQHIPIYRLMQAAIIKGSFVDHYNRESRRRYVR